MSKCLLSTILRMLPNTSLTFSRAFSCSKYRFANYYETLKVSPNASAKEIKEAYFKLSKENHPDLHPNDPTCHDRFIQLQEAYKVLSTAASRKEYDARSGNRRSAYYNASQRPYADPDFSVRDEWIKKQNERIREQYGAHFGRRQDDPRKYNSYYSQPHNLTPEEMKLFWKRKKYESTQGVIQLIVFFVVTMFVITVGESLYFSKTREEHINDMMIKRARLLESMRDPYYRDQSMWDDRDRQKMQAIERNLYGDD